MGQGMIYRIKYITFKKVSFQNNKKQVFILTGYIFLEWHLNRTVYSCLLHYHDINPVLNSHV